MTPASAPERPSPGPATYDPARRRVAHKRARQRGRYVYIPAVELEAAGFDPDGPIYYRTNGYQRSANAGSVIVSLYREA
jgi:hypothetical protein